MKREESDILAADRVAGELTRLIFEGVLRPDQKLPPERRLCDKLGVSRAALREGLQVLRARGLVTTTHGQGTYVLKFNFDKTDAPLIKLFSTQPQTLYDLLDVRALLEGESARLAAMRGTDADFVLISRRYEDLRSAQSLDTPLDPVAHARLDYAFHLSICEASHNPVLVHTLRTLTDLLLSSVFAALSNLYHRMPHKQLIDDQHARLFQAVIARQPASAQQAALEHLHGISDSLREIEKDEQRLIRSGMRLNGWQ